MSVAQNLAYAAIQVTHNMGAVAVVGGSLAAVKLRSADTKRKLAKLVIGGWGTQAVSGAAFGAVSYYFYRRFPDISGIAATALEIKIACAATGFILLATLLFRGNAWSATRMKAMWLASFALAVAALCAAAFLRWFS